jgi:hypothetical protein
MPNDMKPGTKNAGNHAKKKAIYIVKSAGNHRKRGRKKGNLARNWACAITSLPAMIGMIARDWIALGFSKPYCFLLLKKKKKKKIS